MIDYHLHSYLCRHGHGDIYQYVESAIEKGLSEIGFAEHIPVPELDDPTGRMAIEDWDTYIDDVLAAQKNYPDIIVRLGVEADYLPPHMRFIEKFLAAYPFDYVIGSVHFVADWDFSNPALAHRLDEIGVNRLYTLYYQLIQEAADTGLYDIIGHFDLPKKTGVAPTDDISDNITAALVRLQKNDLVLDVNTSGLRKEPGEIYPGRDILEHAFQLNIPVTMGSDAHHPSEVAADFAKTRTMLKEIGYMTCSVFNQRQRTRVDL
ncbi:histidinol-phosphatase HisJ family protein [candidate division KSB1 bacterium]|nr:histidinol-phosphatase HisJ family protein [candidate division KSB1 bacterium]RQW07193.1 MAG: histidinol-phosphatase HisJ family protein [candidate division KSB1 bacterium]